MRHPRSGLDRTRALQEPVVQTLWPALGSTEKAFSHFNSERLPLGVNSEFHKVSVGDSAEFVKPGLENHGLQGLTVTPVSAQRGYQIRRTPYTSPRSSAARVFLTMVGDSGALPDKLTKCRNCGPLFQGLTLPQSCGPPLPEGHAATPRLEAPPLIFRFQQRFQTCHLHEYTILE